MSRIRANRITNQNADGAPVFPNGIVVTGVVTSTNLNPSISGDLSISDKIVHTGDTNTAIRFPAADTITAETSGTERFRISSDGKIGIGTDSPDSDAYIHIVGPDNGKIILEDNDNNGANLRQNYIGIQGSDNLILAADEDDLGSSSSIRFRIDNTEKVRITSGGRVGIGTDSPESLLDIVGSKTGVNFSVDGTVEVNSNQNWNFSTLRLIREASNTANTKLISFLLDGDSASATGLYENVNLVLRTDSAPTAGSASTTLNAGLELTAPSSIRLGTNGAERFRIDSSGHALPGTNNQYDLGSTSLRWANIYTNDLHLSNEGKTNTVDNTWGNFTIEEGESDLFLINNRSGKKYKFNLTELS